MSDREGAAPGSIRVAASTDVYGAIVQAVGGDRVSVTSFIDNPETDPGAYESTPGDAVTTAAAQLVIGNGGGYDDFLFQLAESAGGERIVLDVSEFSELEREGEEFNEHLWFNLAAMQRLAGRIAQDLGELAPDDADAFDANATQFNEGVDELLARVESIATDFRGARVAATEPLPLYLVVDAGLVNVTPEKFMAASEAGTDAPAAVVQQTLDLLTGPDPVKVVLLNAQTQTPATDRLRAAAKKAGVPEISVNETLSEGFTDYLPWIGAQIEALAQGLQAGA